MRLEDSCRKDADCVQIASQLKQSSRHQYGVFAASSSVKNLTLADIVWRQVNRMLHILLCTQEA